MQLTQFTDLGLRTVMRLAVLDAEETMSTQDVSAQLAVSYNHTTKVVTRLAELGVVAARRGRGGGVRLSATGRSASVGWIARELEGPGEVAQCEGPTPCPLRQACRLRGALREAQEAFFTVLDRFTVEDLARTPTGPVLLALGTR
ncbi:Rrf2 family transcriptional regulator [Cellulosimicrobium sp. NPDC055967]|uniref:Rrf2 family transcriptional regulator n=1 Tax=Cellulosimicrobium sp. NPDC055967 TaxID=3345670 RepID=UPI0035D67756